MGDSNFICTCSVCCIENSDESLFWCLECEQKICSDCKDEHASYDQLMYHSVVALSDYRKLPMEILAISSFCASHDEYYEMYCKNHEKVCCSKCYVEKHTTCREICKLYDVITDLTTTFTINEMREIVENLKSCVDKASKYCISNLKNDEIQQKDDKKLTDKLLESKENEMMTKFESCEEDELVIYRRFLDTFEKLKIDCENETKGLDLISECASDFQIFVAKNDLLKIFLKKLNDLHFRLERGISDLQSYSKEKDVLKSIQASCIDFLISLKDFESCKTFEFTKFPSTGSGHQNVKLKKIMVFHIGMEFITGCVITKSRKFVFACIDMIKVFDEKGHIEFELEVAAYDIAQGHENDIIVVSSGFNYERTLTFINLSGRKILKTIPTSHDIYGIVPYRNQFLYSTQYNGIKIMNVTLESSSDIVYNALNELSYLALHDNYIFGSNCEKHCMVCYNFLGDIIWTFRDQKALYYPVGIDTDSFGNIFVVCNEFCNLLLVSPDGKQYKNLLSAVDGLDEPRALHVDKSHNQILVTNMKNKAFLYDIDYGQLVQTNY